MKMRFPSCFKINDLRHCQIIRSGAASHPVSGCFIRRANDFAENGVNILVVSGDSEERAADAKSEWKLDKLSRAFILPIHAATLGEAGTDGKC